LFYFHPSCLAFLDFFIQFRIEVKSMLVFESTLLFSRFRNEFSQLFMVCQIFKNTVVYGIAYWFALKEFVLLVTKILIRQQLLLETINTRNSSKHPIRFYMSKFLCHLFSEIGIFKKLIDLEHLLLQICKVSSEPV